MASRPRRRFGFFLLVVILAGWMTAVHPDPNVGQDAEDFTLPSVDGGESVTLSDLKGKPVLLVFWATWCGPCRRELPALKKLEEEYGPKGLRIVAVSIDYRQSRKSVAAFKKRYDIPYRVVWDEDSLVSEKYGVSAVPTNVLVDPQGIIRSRRHRLAASLEELIKQYLSEDRRAEKRP